MTGHRTPVSARGGELCMYVNNNWCTNTVTVDSHCSPNLEVNLGAADGDATLAEELNLFFARFDVEPPETATVQPMVHSSFTLTMEVRRTLQAVNLRKATGPDGIPGCVLKNCADQLAGVFTRIFNQSLSQSTVPPCL
ncbi:hypothetical protein QTP86_013360 [Hemibagrus guttatus]|nr:hypothetical protein QTP86_013360 [Hemibagrus guttatus]